MTLIAVILANVIILAGLIYLTINRPSAHDRAMFNAIRTLRAWEGIQQRRKKSAEAWERIQQRRKKSAA